VSAWRRAADDGLGTAFLLASVVGSGIMGERLSGGDAAFTLLANSLATGFALAALIVAFAPRSGAHFNPAVTLAFALRGALPRGEVAPYLLAQCAGAILGVLAAHAMFDVAPVQAYALPRTGWALWWSEMVATFGLVYIVLSCDAERPWAAPLAVGAYIAAAYWFTASTSFANPAVTLARGLTATFSGIRLVDVAPFVAAQLAGAGLAVLAAGREKPQ
jgi:glycerol uptake facilitator-like aquaporin